MFVFFIFGNIETLQNKSKTTSSIFKVRFSHFQTGIAAVLPERQGKGSV